VTHNNPETIPTIAMKTDMHDNPWPPSRCCALKCGKTCHTEMNIELPFCEEHMKDEALLRAWEEVT